VDFKNYLHYSGKGHVDDRLLTRLPVTVEVSHRKNGTNSA